MSRGIRWMAVVLVAAAIWAVSTRLDQAQVAAPVGGGGTRVAVADLVRCFNDFAQTEALRRLMDEETNRLTEEGNKKMQEIKDEQTALQAYSPDSADFFKLNQKVRKMRLEFEVWKALKQEEIGEHYLRWTKRTYEIVTNEIAAVAKKRGFQLVVTREELDMNVADPNMLQQLKVQILNRKVVYSEPQLDLTEEVLANLNAAFERAGGAAALKFGQ